MFDNEININNFPNKFCSLEGLIFYVPKWTAKVLLDFNYYTYLNLSISIRTGHQIAQNECTGSWNDFDMNSCVAFYTSKYKTWYSASTFCEGYGAKILEVYSMDQINQLTSLGKFCNCVSI